MLSGPILYNHNINERKRRMHCHKTSKLWEKGGGGRPGRRDITQLGLLLFSAFHLFFNSL